MRAAPIALFVYKRPQHAQRAIDALLSNPLAANSTLHIFSDGPKGPQDEVAVAAVRQYIRSVRGFAEVIVREQQQNAGLAGSIIDGINSVLTSEPHIIVLEDDLVVSPHFLKYMNDGLRCYKDDAKVASIHGYMYPIHIEHETFFLRGADCWGWATWPRAWSHFNPDAGMLLQQIDAGGLTRAFDMQGAYPYTEMLRMQYGGKIDSWAIRWRAACFIADMLTLYPGKSLVLNIGMDGSGSHGDHTFDYEAALSDQPIIVERIPIEARGDTTEAVASFFRATRSPKRRILRRLNSLLYKHS